MESWTKALPKLESLAYRSLPVMLFILSCHLFWFTNYFSFPRVIDPNSLSYHLGLAVLVYFEANFLYSIVSCVWIDPSIRKLLLANKVRGDWSYCTICQTLRPPRAHHCHSCGVCILRRDHHCGLLGQCIGLANWRYFLNTLIFGFLSCVLMAYFNLHLVLGSYVFSDEWSIGYRLLCMVMPPGFFWLFGLLTLWQTILFISASLTVIISCLLFCLVLHQLHLAIRNQTMSERTTRCEPIRTLNENSTSATRDSSVGHYVNFIHSTPPGLYDLGLTNNLSQFLGKRWFLAILFPWIQSELTTDGLNFVKCK